MDTLHFIMVTRTRQFKSIFNSFYLILACQLGFLEIAQLYIQKHVDINAQENNGWSPLCIGMYHASLYLAYILIALI